MAEFSTITKEELKQKMDSGEDFILMDVLGSESYDKIHLPGAISIDAHEDDFVEKVEERISDKDKEIVVYCASFDCQLSPTAAKKLTGAGYTNIIDFEGGLKEWAKADYPFEGEDVEETKKNILS